MNNYQHYLSKIGGQVLAGNVQLPSLPKQAAIIRDVVMSEPLDLHELIYSVESNVGIATVFIGQANSAFYRGVEPVKSVREAIIRVGVDYAQSLAMRAALRTLYIPRSQAARVWFDQHWQENYWVIAAARYLATWTRHNVGEVTMCAMLHNIGRLPIVIEIDQQNRADELYQNGYQSVAALVPTAPRISYLIAKRWAMSETHCRTALVAGELNKRYNESILNVINFAVVMGRSLFVGLPITEVIDTPEASNVIDILNLDRKQIIRAANQMAATRDD
ncbi:HDOD domain-containing protein [Salinibius halmophilus]|uniref:HDOD domain-containing protein n=1 Tax=Salinibius halmophilus TaxID=1853216 RepID=UPI000E65ED4D|nr:HDOD domain-containing protein [Salinibius halmophilus]